MLRRWSWHLGLGRELGNVFWAMVGIEGAFGSYMSIWPLWIEALGAPVTIVGLVLGSSGFLRLLSLGPSATLAERFGIRRLILIARVIAGLGMLSAAFATHWTQLFIMVVGSAIGELAFPLTQTHVSAHAGANRVRAFTLTFNIGPAVAFAISPLVSGALVAIWGMRAAFVLAACCTAVSLFFFSRMSSARPVKSSAEATTSNYRETLRDGTVRRLLALQFAAIFAMALGTSFVPTFLADVRGLAPATITTIGAMGATGSVLFGLCVARLTRLQQEPLLGIAIAIGLVATSLTVFALGDALWLIVIAFLGRGGLFSAWGLFIAALSEVTDERHRARAFALCEMMGGTAFSFAPMLAGTLYAVRPVLPLAVATGVILLLIPVVLLVQHRLGRFGGRVVVPQIEPEIA
ncbi:MAG: MFS transporter [Chloroflexota bacterium]|nr:MFS transporter [Chloroflexota bacterium]